MDMRVVEFPGLGFRVYLGLPYITIGSFEIYYYGMIITLGLVLGMAYAFKKFRQLGVDPDLAIDAILGGIIGGILGARLYYVAFSWSDFGIDSTSFSTILSSIYSILNPRQGGMAIYGGIIGALAVGLTIAKWRNINMKALLDPIGITFLIGQGIGRWGNYVNIEAFGSNTDSIFGMTGPSIVNYLTSKQEYFASIGITVDPYMPVHPCFFYESVWCLVGAFILSRYIDKRKFDGEVFLMYVGYYGLGRFFIEGLRTDSLMLGSLRVSQVLALLLFISTTLVILTIRSKIKANNDENYLPIFATTPEGLLIVNFVDTNSDEEVSSDSEESETPDESDTSIEKEVGENSDESDNSTEKEVGETPDESQSQSEDSDVDKDSENSESKTES